MHWPSQNTVIVYCLLDTIWFRYGFIVFFKHVLYIVVCPFVLFFLLAIVLSDLRYANSDYLFAIFKLFLNLFISRILSKYMIFAICKSWCLILIYLHIKKLTVSINQPTLEHGKLNETVSRDPSLSSLTLTLKQYAHTIEFTIVHFCPDKHAGKLMRTRYSLLRNTKCICKLWMDRMWLCEVVKMSL